MLATRRAQVLYMQATLIEGLGGKRQIKQASNWTNCPILVARLMDSKCRILGLFDPILHWINLRGHNLQPFVREAANSLSR